MPGLDPNDPAWGFGPGPSPAPAPQQTAAPAVADASASAAPGPSAPPPPVEASPDVNAPGYWQERARQAAVNAGIDPDRFEAQIGQESGYSPDVIYGRRVSSAGAIGIAQLMPGTAASLGVDPTDPEASLQAAARYMAQNIQQFGGNQRAAEAAYDAGAGTILGLTRKYGDAWENYIPQETRTYLAAIDNGSAGATSSSGAVAGFAAPAANPGIASASSAGYGPGDLYPGETNADGEEYQGPVQPTPEENYSAEQAALGHSQSATQQELGGNVSNPTTTGGSPLLTGANELLSGDSDVAKAAQSRVGQAVSSFGGSELARALPASTPGFVRTAADVGPMFVLPELAGVGALEEGGEAVGARTFGEALESGAAHTAVATAAYQGLNKAGLSPQVASLASMVLAGRITPRLLNSRLAQTLGRALTPQEARLANAFASGTIPGDQLPEGELKDALYKAGQAPMFSQEEMPTGQGQDVSSYEQAPANETRGETGTQANAFGPAQPRLGEEASQTTPNTLRSESANAPEPPRSLEALRPDWAKTPVEEQRAADVEAEKQALRDAFVAPPPTGRVSVKPSDLVYRPDLFQTRDTTPGLPYNQARVQDISANWDPSQFTEPKVVSDPENPGKYIVMEGQHRTAAWLMHEGDTPMDARLAPYDIRDPKQLARAQLEADQSNTTTRPLNVREEVRNMRRAEAAGETPDQIAGRLGKNGTYVGKLSDIARVGDQAVDRVVQEPALFEHAAAIGHAMDRYGLNVEDANGLFNRIAQAKKGARPTVTALTETLQKYAPVLAEQGGLFDTGQFAGMRGGLLGIIDANARVRSELSSQINAVKRAVKQANDLASSGKPADQMAAKRLETLGKQRQAELREELAANERDLGRAMRGDLRPREIAEAPPPRTPNSGTGRFPQGPDPDLEDLIANVQAAGAVRPDLLEARRAELSQRVAQAEQARQWYISQGLHPGDAQRLSHGALEGQLADPSFDMPRDLNQDNLGTRIDGSGLQYFTRDAAHRGLEKLANGTIPPPHEVDALGQVFGPRLKFAIEDLGDVFKVQGRAEKAMQRPVDIPGTVTATTNSTTPPITPTVEDLSKAIRSRLPDVDEDTSNKVASRMLEQGKIRVGVNPRTGKATVTYDPEALDTRVTRGLTGPRMYESGHYPPDYSPRLPSAGPFDQDLPPAEPTLTGEMQPNISMGDGTEGPNAAGSPREGFTLNQQRLVRSSRENPPLGPQVPAAPGVEPYGSHTQTNLPGDIGNNLEPMASTPAGEGLNAAGSERQGWTLKQQRLERSLLAMGDEGKVAGAGGEPPRGPRKPSQGSLPDFGNNGRGAARIAYDTAKAGMNNLLDVPGAVTSFKMFGSVPLLRQGLISLVLDPTGSIDAAGKGIAAGFKEARAQDYMQSALNADAKSAPASFTTAEQAGLRLSQWGRGIEAGARESEEQGLGGRSAVSRLAQANPLARFSERSRAVEMNLVRLDRFQSLRQAMWDTGERDPDAYKAAADVLNHQTGYGPLGQGRVPFLFSLRALSGRVMTAVDPFVQPGSLFHASARQEAMKGLLAQVLFGGAVVGTGSFLGAKVVTNGGLPTLSFPGEHGGHTIWDPWAGGNALAKLVIGSVKDVANGNPANVGNRFAHLFANDLGPIPAKIYAALTGTDWANRPIPGSNWLERLVHEAKDPQTAVDLLAPIWGEALVNAIRQHGALTGTGLALPSVLEGTVDTYNESLSDRRNQALQQVRDAGKLTNLPQGAQYSDLGAGEANLVNQQLQKTNPELFGPNGKVTPTYAGPISDAENARATQDALYKGQLDRLYKDLIDGKVDPTTAKNNVSDIRNQRQGALNEIYNKPGYQQAIAQLPGNDMRKLENDYFNIANQADLVGIAETPTDAQGNSGATAYWNAVDAAQGKFLADLKQRDPQLAARFQDDLANMPSSADLSPMLALKKQVDDASKGYYTVLDAEQAARNNGTQFKGQTSAQYLEANPAVNVGRWLYYGDKLRSPEAVNLVMTKSDTLPAAVQSALGDSSFKRDIQVEGLQRPVNQSTQAEVAWGASGKLVSSYLFSFTDNARKAETEYEFGKSVKYEDLGPKAKTYVDGQVESDRTQMLQSNPQLNAWLAWWGHTSGTGDQKLESQAAGDALKAIIQKYGQQPPYKKFQQYEFSANAD